MSSTLEERLKTNSSAFDGLLSLIPAKYYYDDDTQDQWRAKKQSKEQLKENKRAKLDPESEQEQEDEENNNNDEEKVKVNGKSAAQVLKKREKSAKPVVLPGVKKLPSPVEESTPVPTTASSKSQQQEEGEEEDETINVIFDDEGNEISPELSSSATATPSPVKANQAAPDVTTTNGSKSKKELTPEERQKKEQSIRALREKLSSKIQMLKEKRNAPGTTVKNGKSATVISREAILEERKRKAELKAAAKAEKKRKLAEMEAEDSDKSDSEEDESEDEEDDELSAKGVLYQNIVFNDDSKVTSDLKNIRTNHLKKKGPAKKDINGHLKLLEQKKEKLATMDETKKKTIEEREKWARMLAAAEGTKLRDDEKLLKKALKRKESQKRKSELEWRDRKDHVENMKQAKVKRREENLQIRKENKGLKRKQQTKQLRKFKVGKSGKRAGFEGRLKSGKGKGGPAKK